MMSTILLPLPRSSGMTLLKIDDPTELTNALTSYLIPTLVSELLESFTAAKWN